MKDYFYVKPTDSGKTVAETIQFGARFLGAEGYIVFHQQASHTTLDIAKKV